MVRIVRGVIRHANLAAKNAGICARVSLLKLDFCPGKTAVNGNAID